jgi:2-(1,2-epoxy-1,2-dihydrophenyl)acetyl-CoA isomerase
VFNRVVPDGELAATAFDWARAIAAGPSTAYASMKENVRQAATLSLGEAIPLESERMVASGRTAFHRSAVRAWLEAAKARTETAE